MSSSPHMPFPSAGCQVTIKDLFCNNLPKHGVLRKQAGSHYLIISVHNQVERTAEAKGSDPSWREEFHFVVSEPDRLRICLYAKQKIGRDALVDEVEIEIGSVLSRGPSTVTTRGLLLGKSSITFTLALSSGPVLTKVMSDTVPRTKAEPPLSLTRSLSPRSTIGSAADAPDPTPLGLASLSAALVPLVEKLEAFAAIATWISEIHPYAKVACALFIIPCKIFLQQHRRDQNMQTLVETIDEAYAFVLQAEPLRRIESQRKTIELLVKQTVECGYFIKEYAEDKTFATRAFKHITGGVDRKISEFTSNIASLNSTFLGQAAITTEITVLRIWDKVDEQGSTALLNDLPYARGAGCQPDKMCLPGTRTDILDEIVDWVHLPNAYDVPRICLLTGVAGSGKSAIANTVAVRFRQMKRLGSSFCFDASKQSERRPELLFSTIARDFSDLDVQWRHTLAKVVADSAALRTTSSILEQFDNFLIAPAHGLSILGPIVFVIDALDECSKGPSRRSMLQMLAERSAELPPNFRILITSRPDDDITAAFARNRNVCWKTMEGIGAESTNADIASYVEKRLVNVQVWDDRWPNREWIGLLVARSENLFQWAFTACEYITESETGAGSDPSEQVASLLSASKQDGLDGLYNTILERVFKFKDCHEDDPRVHRFRAIMGRVLSAREPLSMNSLVELRRDGERANEADLILRHLGSVLRGVYAKEVPIQPLHTSFRDFLTDRSRSGVYFVNFQSCAQDLGISCLRVMKAGLKFNICHLESSYVRNSDIYDLAYRIETYIPHHLSYSCKFWAYHLPNASFTPELEEEIKGLIKQKLLFWLEALSLLKDVSAALQSLQGVRVWAQNCGCPVADLAEGALQFLRRFAVPLVHSAPHLYISAVPFAFDHPALAWCRTDFPRTLAIASTSVAGPPLIEMELKGDLFAFSPDSNRIITVSDTAIRIWSLHTSELVGPPLDFEPSIVSAIFSPNGKRIISVSDMRHVRISDAETGELLKEPFNEPPQTPDGCITSGSFSLNTDRVVLLSVDRTLTVLDLTTGRVIVEILRAHDSRVTCVAISPDGCFVVAGSEGHGIKMWNAQTGKSVPLFFETPEDEGNCVHSVAYSPDGDYIAAGTHDRTVRVLSCHTGKLLCKPFRGHAAAVRSVAFSPDGGRVISGSEDKTIRIWNVQTGQIHSGPFKSQRRAVIAVGFSPDGKHFTSGSEDGGVVIWNSAAEFGPSDLLERHTAGIETAIFSPDGTRIFSGSGDSTAKVWDILTGTATSPTPLLGHKDAVTAVALSADGKRIVSATPSGTVISWDADKGNIVVGPLELEGHDGSISSVAFSPGGDLVLCGSVSGSVRICDVMTGKVVAGPLPDSDSVTSVAFSGDGKRIAYGTGTAKVGIWDLQADNPTAALLASHTDAVACVAFSPDGEHVAAASWDTIKLWSTRTRQIVRELECSQDGPRYKSITFSPDSNFVVAGSFDQGIRIWETSTGKAAAGPLYGHTDVVNSVAFSRNGNFIVSASDDQAMRVWDFEAALQRGPRKHVDFATENSSRPFDQQIQFPVPFRSSSFDAAHHVSDFARLSSVLTNDYKIEDDDFKIEDGWVRGASGELMFWLPHAHRRGLWRPRNTCVISKNTTELDFSKFVHGASWAQCYSGQASD